MPAFHVTLHLLLSLLLVWATLRLAPRRPLALALGTAALLLVVAGMVVERHLEWAWSAMLLQWPDAVFWTNLSLEGISILLAAVWRAAADVSARKRALFLTPLAVGAALWSYGWYFQALPPGLRGRADVRGYCPQTNPTSCSAAAAVMLLHHHGIPTTERAMASLCLTRDRLGTSPLGLYRGLHLKTQRSGLRPRLHQISSVSDLARLGRPAILSIGLRRSLPADTAIRMAQAGWAPGQYHSVVALEADPQGRWLLVADPSYGVERWPTRDLELLWDHRALVLEPR